MPNIVDLTEYRKRLRDQLTAEILHNDEHPVIDDVETDRAIASLNRLMDETPLSYEEKIVVFWTKLVEHLADIDDEKERNAYLQRIRKLLSEGVVDAARDAFARMK